MSSRETQLALQIDTGVKEMAKVILKASGLTVRDAGNDLLTRVISSDDIPFVVSRDPELRAIGITETMRRHFGLDGKEWPIASGETKPMCSTWTKVCSKRPRRSSTTTASLPPPSSAPS